MQNSKTTILGILMIVGALIHAVSQYLSGQPVDTTVIFGAVSGGIGLIAAKDSTTHSTVTEVHQATVVADSKDVK